MAWCISPAGEYTWWGWRTSKGPFGETGCAIRCELWSSNAGRAVRRERGKWEAVAEDGGRQGVEYLQVCDVAPW